MGRKAIQTPAGAVRRRAPARTPPRHRDRPKGPSSSPPWSSVLPARPPLLWDYATSLMLSCATLLDELRLWQILIS